MSVLVRTSGDPLALGLLLVAVLAALIPATRAVRVNPLVALRGD